MVPVGHTPPATADPAMIRTPQTPTAPAQPSSHPRPPGAATLWLRADGPGADVAARCASGALTTSADLFALAADAYGGTLAQGAFTPRDAYDAAELGLHLHLLRAVGRLPPRPRRPRRARRGRAALGAPAQPDAPDGGAERLPAVLDARRLRGALRLGERGRGGAPRPGTLRRDRRALRVRAGRRRDGPRQRALRPTGRPAGGPAGGGGPGPVPDAHARERRPPRRHPPAYRPGRRGPDEPPVLPRPPGASAAAGSRRSGPTTCSRPSAASTQADGWWPSSARASAGASRRTGRSSRPRRRPVPAPGRRRGRRGRLPPYGTSVRTRLLVVDRASENAPSGDRGRVEAVVETVGDAVDVLVPVRRVLEDR